MSASELSQIAEFLNVPISGFFGNAVDNVEIQEVLKFVILISRIRLVSSPSINMTSYKSKASFR